MSMGYEANCVDTIDDKDVKEICPKEWADLQNTLVHEGITLDEHAMNVSLQDEFNVRVDEKIEALSQAFNKATGGLLLDIDYHNPEEGDRYDDVSGWYWSLGGVYELTEAGQRYANLIRRAFFVTFG